jgi:Bacterial SH3 domain
MSEKKKEGFWLNIETIIIGAFFLFFIVWAAQKCNSSSKGKQAEIDKNRQAFIRDSINRAKTIAPVVPLPVTPLAQTTVQSTTPPAAVPIPAPTTPTVVAPRTTVPATTPTAPAKTEGQQLYVTIDGLNVRAEPNLKAKSFGKLKLFDQVTFLGKVTEDAQKLSLGTDEAEEPWVKIKTKRGTIGWVYGAGVSYYKKKRKGVL